MATVAELFPVGSRVRRRKPPLMGDGTVEGHTASALIRGGEAVQVRWDVPPTLDAEGKPDETFRVFTSAKDSLERI